MFEGRMEYMSLEKPVGVRDRTGFSYTEWERQDEDIRLYIVRKSANAYRTNELNLVESDYVGFTTDKRVRKGDRIGGTMLVDYTGPKAISLSSIGKDEQ